MPRSIDDGFFTYIIASFQIVEEIALTVPF
jgi:hypothetical protein